MGRRSVDSQGPAEIAGRSEQSHEPARSGLVTRIQPHCSADGVDLGLTGALQLASALPCGGTQRVAKLIPLLVEPALEVRSAGDVEAGRQIARPKRHGFADALGGEARTYKVERVAFERAEVEADVRLATSDDRFVADRLRATRGERFAQGMPRRGVVRLGPEQRHQPFPRMKAGRFGERQVEQQRQSLRLRENALRAVGSVRGGRRGRRAPENQSWMRAGDGTGTGRGRIADATNLPSASRFHTPCLRGNVHMNTHVTIPRAHARLRLARHVGSIVLAAASCREAAAPTEPNATVARLSVASPTQLKGTVVTAVTDAPSVAVHDASGKALAGVVVTFSVRSGAGAIETPHVVSTPPESRASAGGRSETCGERTCSWRRSPLAIPSFSPPTHSLARHSFSRRSAATDRSRRREPAWVFARGSGSAICTKTRFLGSR